MSTEVGAIDDLRDEALPGNLEEEEQPASAATAAHARLPFGFASAHGVRLEEEGQRTLLYRPGLSLDVLLELQRYLGTDLVLQEIPAEDFQRRLTREYQSGEGAAQRAAEDLGAEFDLSSLADDLADRTDLLAGDDDAPIIRLINAILSQAVREGASDIHLEPFEDRVSVRFRVDGVLNEVLSPKAELAPVLVSRLKVMARLDIAEKRLPQDGRITVLLAG